MTEMLLPVQILSPATETNGGLVKFPGGRKIILGKTDADALRAAGRADSIRERGRYYDIIVEALVDYDGWMLDDDYDATPVLNRIMKRMRDRLEMSAPPLPTQPAREEVREAKTDTAQTMLELADRLQQRSNDILEQSGTSQHQIDCAMAAKFLRSPAIGTPDDAREALTEWFDRLDFDRNNEATRHAEYAEMLSILAALPREQEVKPVAWRVKFEGDASWILYYSDPRLLENEGVPEIVEPLYAAPPSDSPGSAHQPQGGSFTERAIKLIREAAGHQDDWGKYEYAVIDLAREADSAHQPQGDAREAIARLVCCGPKGCILDSADCVCIAMDPEYGNAETADAILALATPPAPVRADWSWGVDYGKDLLVDLNQLAHASGTTALLRDGLQRAYKEISRLRKASAPVRAAAGSVKETDCEMAFIEACDEIGCAYDNEALLQAISDLKLRAEPVNSLGKCLDLIDEWDRRGSIDHSLAFELHTKLKKVWAALSPDSTGWEPSSPSIRQSSPVLSTPHNSGERLRSGDAAGAGDDTAERGYVPYTAEEAEVHIEGYEGHTPSTERNTP